MNERGAHYATTASGKTAIRRRKVSAPMRFLMHKGWICDALETDPMILDYGAGHGADVRAMREAGLSAYGYDPIHGGSAGSAYATVITDTLDSFTYRAVAFDYIACTYVLNVANNALHAEEIIEDIYNRLTDHGVAYITVRADVPNGSDTQADVVLRLPLIRTTKSMRIYILRASDHNTFNDYVESFTKGGNA